MKKEPNNEMDLMLRRLGQSLSQPATQSENGDGASIPEVHLDADELNAYAENALPASARVRYTAHLADCVRCRRIVSQLSQSAGLVFEEKPLPEPPVSGLQRFFSSLFSPVVLRYAVPALGIVLVGALWMVTFRTARRADVAMLRPTGGLTERAQPSAPATATVEEPAKQTSGPPDQASNRVAGNQSQDNQKSDAAQADRKALQREGKREQEPVAAVDQVAAAQPAPAVANEPPRAKEVSNEKKAVGAADTAARQEQPVTTVTESVSVESQKELAKSRDAEAGARVGGFASASSTPTANKTSRAMKPGASDQGRVLSDKDEAETRSAGGHQFRRQGSRWVDVTYDSRPTINVARNSEQYRALVADEPTLKTIADQLSGEIIVMWNSRAYRIR